MGLEWTSVVTVGKGGMIELRVPVLAEGATVEVVIRGESNVSPKKRIFGHAKGQGTMRTDFDEPLIDCNEYRGCVF